MSSIMTIDSLNAAKQASAEGIEYWFARDIQPILGYQSWEYFHAAIQRAMVACEGTGVEVANHFLDTPKMVSLGSGSMREITDYILSRYACYLIAMNGEPSIPEIAVAQGYFAVQARKMEMEEEAGYNDRLDMRNKVTVANKALGNAAKEAGVIKYGVFHNAGYRGLYGMDLNKVKERKGIQKEDLLDRAGHAELAANYFRITQTEEKLRRDGIKGETSAINTHEAVGKAVRKTIQELGGTMPEDLPPEDNIKKLAKDKAKAITKD